MSLPENQICSDCPERQPRWASLIVPPPGAPPGSLPMGAFCCLECSGSHRRLGVHISFVRSVNLDQWKEKEVLAMENGGNKKVNLIFEANLNNNTSKPSNTASGPVRERFIRDKYERRKFYDPNAFALVDEMMTSGVSDTHPSSAASAGEQQQVIAGVQRRLQQSQIRKPSDAARKRVEERAARSRGNINNGGTVKSGKIGVPSVKTPSKGNDVVSTTPAPPVVDLLDFGDFDSPEATEAVVASSSGGVGGNAPATSASNDVPALDLFSQMSVNNDAGTTNNAGLVGSDTNNNNAMQGMVTMQNVQQPQQQVQQPQQPKMSTADILNMFNTPNPSNVMQQNMFAMGGGGAVAGGGGNNAMMMNQNGMTMGMPVGGGNMMNPVGNYSNNMMMHSNNNFGGNTAMMNNGMGMPTTGNSNMMMMGGNNNNNNNMMMGTMNNNQMNMMNNNPMMLQQQQFQGQIPTMNGMQQGNGGSSGGGMMPGGNQFGQVSQRQTSRQSRGMSHHDQFAEFGSFGR